MERTVDRVIVKSQCEVVTSLTPDTTCRERINPRPTHPVIVVVLKLLVVDRCPTRISSIFGQWGSLGSLGWIMRAFYSYYAP